MQDAVMEERFDANRYRVRVQGWLNDAYLKLRRRLDLPEEDGSIALVTVAGQADYDLPADFAAVQRIALLGLGFLHEGSRADIEEYDAGYRSRPEVYVLTGSPLRLRLGPTPDAAYTFQLDYAVSTPRMTQETDVPALPDEFHDLLVTYATAKAYRSEEDREMHDSWMVDFEAESWRMKGELEDRGGDGPEQVPGMWGLDGFRG